MMKTMWMMWMKIMKQRILRITRRVIIKVDRVRGSSYKADRVIKVNKVTKGNQSKDKSNNYNSSKDYKLNKNNSKSNKINKYKNREEIQIFRNKFL